MCRTKKIENDLHWVEGLERDLNKECIPLAHRTIPKTRKLKSLEFTSLIALRRNEAGILVDILEEIETLSLLVMKTAYDIYRIEVSRRSKGVT